MEGAKLKEFVFSQENNFSYYTNNVDEYTEIFVLGTGLNVKSECYFELALSMAGHNSKIIVSNLPGHQKQRKEDLCLDKMSKYYSILHQQVKEECRDKNLKAYLLAHSLSGFLDIHSTNQNEIFYKKVYLAPAISLRFDSVLKTNLTNILSSIPIPSFNFRHERVHHTIPFSFYKKLSNQIKGLAAINFDLKESTNQIVLMDRKDELLSFNGVAKIFSGFAKIEQVQAGFPHHNLYDLNTFKSTDREDFINKVKSYFNY